MQSETLKTDKHIQQQPENTALLLWIESRKVTEPPNGITQERKTTIRIVLHVSSPTECYVLYGLFIK